MRAYGYQFHIGPGLQSKTDQSGTRVQGSDGLKVTITENLLSADRGAKYSLSLNCPGQASRRPGSSAHSHQGPLSFSWLLCLRPHLTSAAGGCYLPHLGEVAVVEGLLGGDPVVGVVGEQLGQEAVATFGELSWEDLPDVLRRIPPGED